MPNTHETLESLFTDTANAIRKKTGGTADIVADEFPAAIESIPSGGGPVTRTNKYRPPDWPDYDSLTLPDRSMAFFTFDTQICDPADLVCNVCWYDYTPAAPNYRVIVDRGHIENGQFIITKSWENLYFAIQDPKQTALPDIDRAIPTDEGRYVVYRVWCPVAASSHTLVSYFKDYNDLNGNARLAQFSPMVEAFFWKCGTSSVSIRGYDMCSIYTQMLTYKHCYTSDGTTLFWSNAQRIPRYVELDGRKGSGFSWYYPFNGASNFERISLKNFTMDNTNGTGAAFNGCSRLAGVDFINMTVKTVSLNLCFSGCESLRELDLHGWNVSAVTNASSCFANCKGLIDLDISGWNLSAVTNSGNMFQNCTSLKNVKCDGATLPSIAISFANSNLITDGSLVNIANALPTASATLTLHATPKGRLNSIMGTVSGGVFTAASGGSVSLQSFITQTKGWTIA